MKTPLTVSGPRPWSALLVACGLLLGSWVQAVAPEPAGMVVAVRGEVTVTRADGKAAPLALKDAVFQSDTLKTGDRGRVQVCFTDETILSLGRNTQIQITECVFKRSEGQGALSLNVNEGVFRIVGGAIMKIAPENFKTTTPTATIGIRGSSFAAEVSAELTTVVLLGTTGAGITIENDNGYRIVYIPGTGLSVPVGEAPGSVRPMDKEAVALLGQTAVGGAGSSDPSAKPPAPAVEKGSGGKSGGASTPAPAEAPVPEGEPGDPHAIILGYPTDSDTRTVLDKPTEPPVKPMPTVLPLGQAIGLDLTTGWVLRSLTPNEVSVTVAISGTHLDAVTGGGMTLHAEASGTSAATFSTKSPQEAPEDPGQSPAMPFTFQDGVIGGNSAMVVTNSTIQPSADAADLSDWGWWEMDLNDPNHSGPAHHAVGLWQATSLARTAAEYVRDSLLGGDFTGTYSGSAHCLRNGADRFDGTSRFSLDFSDKTFTGDFNFSAGGGPTMDLTGDINENGIQGHVRTISGEGPVQSSALQGTFYGSDSVSDPHTVQGAFDARSPVNHYLGIFNAGGTARSARR